VERLRLAKGFFFRGRFLFFIFISFSGNTKETLSVFKKALAQKAIFVLQPAVAN
jgi:hypothetical protein